MTAAERREALRFYADAQYWSGNPAYTSERYCADRCFDDLKVLAAQGLVQRLLGRPARWKAVEG